MELKTEVEGATNVAEDPLDKVEMRLPRGMHVEARLLDDMINVGTGERQVLKRPGKAPVLSSIGDEWSLIGRELATCVDGCHTRATVHHTGALKKVDGVLALREKHPRSRERDRDPEEVRQVPEIGHGELPVELVGDVLEKRGAGRGEDDVVHVEEQVGHLRAVPEHEQRHVALRSHKAQSMSVMSEPLVPRAGRLLESIEGLVEQADMVRTRRVDEAGWLLTVNHLV